MFIEALQLIGLPVAAEDSLSKIGAICQIIIDPASGRVLGFLVSVGFWGDKKALSIMDIKFWDPNGLVTANAENLVEPAEIIRLKQVLDLGINLLKMPARTESNKSLGRVENFLIDTEAQVVVKYYLRGLLGQTRVMPTAKIIRIDKEIVFTDDEGATRSGVIETQIASL